MKDALESPAPNRGDWKIVKLAEVCQFKPPKSIPRNALNENDAVSFVPMNDLGELVKYFGGRENKPLASVIKGYTYFADNDVLCAKITPCFENGKLGIARGLMNGTGFGSSEFVVMRSGPRLLPEYLYYFLARDEFREAGARVMSGAVGHKRVPKEYFENLAIPLPPLEEQKRIVAKLDQAFAALDRARAHTKANLADSDELFDASKRHFLSEVEGPTQTVTLGDVTHIATKLVDPREPEYFDLPHVGAGNMITGSDELVDVLTARQEKLKSGKFLFQPGMVLYSKIRPYLRKAARPDFRGLCSADVYPLSPGSCLDGNFLFHILLGKDFTDYAISGSDRAGMPKVNRDHLFRYKFQLPPLEEQRSIVEKIDDALTATGIIREKGREKLGRIDSLRKSLLQEAFLGRLT